MDEADGDDAPPSLSREGYKSLALAEAERAFYTALARDIGARTRVQDFVIPKTEGKAFSAEEGQILRIACDRGSQVADFIAFNHDDPREAFSASGTRIVHGLHVRLQDRLWSVAPFARPMFTIIADTLDGRVSPSGALAHDVLFGPCDHANYQRMTGQMGRPNCRGNLARAIAAFGLRPEHVHDPFNIFMTTGVQPNGRMFYVDPQARQGDYIELYAEMPVRVAISACPGASSGPGPGGLRIAVYDTTLRRGAARPAHTRDATTDSTRVAAGNRGARDVDREKTLPKVALLVELAPTLAPRAHGFDQAPNAAIRGRVRTARGLRFAEARGHPTRF